MSFIPNDSIWGNIKCRMPASIFFVNVYPLRRVSSETTPYFCPVIKGYCAGLPSIFTVLYLSKQSRCETQPKVEFWDFKREKWMSFRQKIRMLQHACLLPDRAIEVSMAL